MDKEKFKDKKIEVSAKVLGAVLKSNLELRKLVAELLERPGLAKEHLTVRELMKEYGISRKVFDGFRKKGLKVIQKSPNGTIWVKRSEIDKFLMKK